MHVLRCASHLSLQNAVRDSVMCAAIEQVTSWEAEQELPISKYADNLPFVSVIIPTNSTYVYHWSLLLSTKLHL
jgi:hypothetical protein